MIRIDGMRGHRFSMRQPADYMRNSQIIILFVMILCCGYPAQATEVGIWSGFIGNAPQALVNYQKWLGSPPRHATTNFDQSSWPALMNEASMDLGVWRPGYNKLVDSPTQYGLNGPLDMTFSIPMLPSDGVSTLAAGAVGQYDRYFTQIGQWLVATGFADVTVRIGWEFNGNWQPWASYKDPANFVRFFQRIVMLLRKVPGARFKIDWCPNIGTYALAPDQSYPGDDYVDFIGMDVYEAHRDASDTTPEQRWNLDLTKPFGLQWQVEFAAAHHKLLSLPEWGCCGRKSGDDAYWMSHMVNWIKTNNYSYATYWDLNADYVGQLSNNQYPLAGAAYIAGFR